MNATTAEASAAEVESPLAHLSSEQLDALARELDEIRDRVFADLGERDRRYIESMIAMQRRLAVIGRVLLLAARYRPAKAAGTAALSAAKILENMEIGHNVMHGQWDWMNDPQIHSSTWDWDTASTKEAWKYSHNYIHHTFTNIRGKDKDLGYEIMRIDPHQDWHPAYLLQPIYNLILMALFEWGVALHDMDFDAIRSGEKSQKEVLRQLNGIFYKARLQVTKDYIAWPVLSGLVMTLIDLGLTAAGVNLGEARPRNETRRQKAARKLRRARRRTSRKVPTRAARVQGIVLDLVARKSFREPFKRTLQANVVANIIRNVWAYAIIFCGHFPDQTYTFSQEETEDETPGRRYVRQLIGAANIEGGPLFHVISGNLGYQVEHHLYPDMPSTRYGEIAPRVREICKEYDLPYNSGPFFQQIGMVQRTILRLAFPGGKPRPKPGPYRGETVKTAGERELQTVGADAASSNGGG